MFLQFKITFLFLNIIYSCYGKTDSSQCYLILQKSYYADLVLKKSLVMNIENSRSAECLWKWLYLFFFSLPSGFFL